MIEAILAVVGAILGVVNTVVGGGNQKFLAKSAEYEANIAFQRDKESALYGMYRSQQTTRTVIIICGILFLIGLAFVLTRKEGK